MTKYEYMLDSASKYNVTVHENYDFNGTRIKGLYCDGNVALSRDLDTDAEKRCILSEELGHFHTSSGNIIDLHDTGNIKQEYRARLWAYDHLIGLQGIINAYNAGCFSLFDTADFLGVTEEFLHEAIIAYKAKYGISAVCGNFVVYFEPMGVMRLV